MSTADQAWQEWSDANLEFGALGSFALVAKPVWDAAYRRALEDAADVAEHNAKWGLTRDAKHFGKVYAKLFRDRAAGVGTKDGDDDANRT